ncbi:putative transposase [Pseudoloma neurophilia]|uniref:Putative transposase n=1 Tax=Pseudoloma neurophilia TaxID=146866 RepID=A0A0R0M370_9MICR|nr:putative transposase [Pseudoloma neurophilia]
MYANTFLRLISEDDGNNCFFIDEVGFQLSIRRTRGRSLIGICATTTVQGLRSNNINACAIISKHGILHYKLERTAYNTTKFSEFLNEVFEKFEELNIRNACLIMDNASFHETPQIAAIIRNRGHRILLLPPYSPFLNPIEHLFSQWKEHIRQGTPQTTEQNFSLIHMAVSLITWQNCRNYYTRMIGVL